MFDSQTVAHEIRYPWRKYGRSGRNEFEKGYRESFVTIWHVDPLNFKGKCGRLRDDDSCGWFCPPYTPAIRDAIKKLAKEQYGHIFEKQVRAAEGADYARICNEPDCHSAIYWSWRAIKHKFKPRGPWQYGVRLTASEREAIYDLATCPVDNLKLTFDGVANLESFESFFFIVFHVYLRHHRAWYRHPRWHFWHWRFQVHPWQTFRRWAFSRCAGCGRGFTWGYSPVSHSWDSKRPKLFCSEEGVYHSECSNMTTALNREPVAGNA